MASTAVAIGGMNNAEIKSEKTCWRLTDIVTQIHEATHKINEVSYLFDNYNQAYPGMMTKNIANRNNEMANIQVLYFYPASSLAPE